MSYTLLPQPIRNSLFSSCLSIYSEHSVPSSSTFSKRHNGEITWHQIVSSRITHLIVAILHSLRIALSTIITCITLCYRKVIPSSSYPEIMDDTWGRITIKTDKVQQSFRDAIILPHTVFEWRWDWAVGNPMHHNPGIRTIDIDYYIYEHCSTSSLDAIILTQGRGHGGRRDNPGEGILKCENRVESYIASKGIREIYILKSAPAVDKYRQLIAQGKKVAMLFHSTC